MIDTVATGRSPATRVSGGVHGRFRSFFPIVSGILLAGLLIGFAPSFFLRGRINVPFQLASLPPYLVIHGTVLTTWFVLMFVQSCLVSAHRTDLHRRLGIAAIGIATLVIPVSALVVVRAVPRLISVGFPRPALYGIILGDFVALSLFCAFVGGAVYTRRRRTDIHKRLMIASCFTIYGPVLSRLGSFYGLHASVPVATSVMFGCLAMYDVVTLKRVHVATLLSAAAAIGVFAVAMEVLIRTGVADAVIDAFAMSAAFKD